MVSSMHSRYWFFLLFVLHVQLSQARIEKWCRCTLLDEICCLDIRETRKDSPVNDTDFKDWDCLCTSRTYFLSNPFLKQHPYFLKFPNLTLNSEAYDQTPGLMMKYSDLPSDHVAYPNLLEDERNLRLLTRLRENISEETWSHLNESGNEDLFALLLEPKSFEILVALQQAGVIKNISNLSTSFGNINLSLVPNATLMYNEEFIRYYNYTIKDSTTYEKLKTYNTGSSTVPGAILGILFVFVVGCILFCLAIQRGMSKDHSM